MENIKITFITAAYNSFKTIEQTINSILGQSYKNIEYIIVDGESTDGTVDIIKKYQGKIKWISEPDDGIYDAWLKGIELATGDYISILGSDDCLIDYTVVAHVVELLVDNPDILSCNRLCVDENHGWQFEATNEAVKYNKQVEHKTIPTEGMYFKPKLVQKYPFDLKYKMAADFKFFLQCYYDPDIRIKYSNLFVVFYSLSGISSCTDCIDEFNSIYNELDLPMREKHKSEKKIIRKIKDKLKSIFWIYRFYMRRRFNIKLSKHHCNNKICRWCGRK